MCLRRRRRRRRRWQPAAGAGVLLRLRGRCGKDTRPCVRIGHRMRRCRMEMMCRMMMGRRWRRRRLLWVVVVRIVRRPRPMVRMVRVVAVLMVRRRHSPAVIIVRSVLAGVLVGRQHALGDQFAQLLLPDAVVAVRHQVLAHLGQCVRGARVRLGGRRQRRDLHVQFVVQVGVLRVVRAAQLLFLCGAKRETGGVSVEFPQRYKFLATIYAADARTLFRSFIEPRPSTAILHMVSSCRRLSELPLGPSSLPTKLNWRRKWRKPRYRCASRAIHMVEFGGKRIRSVQLNATMCCYL